MNRPQLPDWVKEPLRADIEEQVWLLTDEVSSRWVNLRERGRCEREKGVRENRYKLNVILQLLGDPRSEKVFDELEEIARGDECLIELPGFEPHSSKDSDPYLQLRIARTVMKSLKPVKVSTPTVLNNWEVDVEKSTTKLISLLRNCPPEKSHIKLFNPKTIRSLVNPRRYQKFLNVLGMVSEIDIDGKTKDKLSEDVEELFDEDGEHLEDQFTLIELLQWLLKSGQIQVGKAVGTKTKGLLAERAYFVRAFSDHWKKNRYSFEGYLSNRLIADLASIVFPTIDEQGVSRLLTKWK